MVWLLQAHMVLRPASTLTKVETWVLAAIYQRVLLLNEEITRQPPSFYKPSLRRHCKERAFFNFKLNKADKLPQEIAEKTLEKFRTLEDDLADGNRTTESPPDAQ